MPLPATFAALRHRNYRWFFAGQFVSLIGSWMQGTAQQWLVVLLASRDGASSDANYYLGLATAVGSLPMLAGALVGGLVADRLPKRAIILAMQVCQGLLAVGMAYLVATGRATLNHVLLFSALLGLTNVFDIPARQAFVIEMVGKEDLHNAIGLNSSLFNASRIVGPAIAGLLIARLGGNGEFDALARCFLVNGLSYIAVIVGLMAMRGDFSARAVGKESPLVQLREAGRYFRDSRPALLLVTLMAAFSVLMTADWVLLPSLAHFTLGADAPQFGFLMAVKGAGALVGALTVATLARSPHRGAVLIAASLLTPALSLCLALSRSYPLSCVILLLEGMAVVCFMATANSLQQTAVPDALRGRVMGVQAWINMGLTPVGSAWAGALAQRTSAPVAVATGALLMLAVGGFLALRFPELRRTEPT